MLIHPKLSSHKGLWYYEIQAVSIREQNEVETDYGRAETRE
jgi:hypothetical protein